jgi:thiol-disulfide isomerase/thioredoxin
MFWLSFLIPVINSMQQDDGLLEVDDVNFTEQLEGKEALVLFYDPLCPGSNPAYHEYYKTFKNLAVQGNFVMAKYDLYSNIHIATAFQIYTSPSLLYYKGNDSFIYPREITSKNLALLIENILDPQLKIIEKEKISDFLRPEIISFLLFDDVDSALSRKIARSTKMNPPVSIAHCTSQEAAKSLGLSWGRLHALNLYHGIKDSLKENTVEAIQDFIKKRDLHKVLPLSSAYDFVIDQGLPAIYIFRNESEGESIARVLNETIENLQDFRVVFGDLNSHVIFSRILGLPATEQPCMMLVEPVKNNLFKYVPSEKEITKKNILALIENWKQRKAQRYLKNGPHVEGEMNGNEIQKYLENTVSDTLVHFFAPWCEHCKKLDLALDNFKKNVTDVKVVKVNAEDNEIPEHVIDEYPVLKFFQPMLKKWTVFKHLRKGTSDLELWERIAAFVKMAKKDKRSQKSTKSDL